jgi:hypothetical protein
MRRHAGKCEGFRTPAAKHTALAFKAAGIRNLSQKLPILRSAPLRDAIPACSIRYHQERKIADRRSLA